MKITAIKSHVLRHDPEGELDSFQQYFAQRRAHLVEVTTEEGITGLLDVFGQVAADDGTTRVAQGPGPGVEPDRNFLEGVTVTAR